MTGHDLNVKFFEPLFAGLPELLKAGQLEEQIQIDRKTVYAMAARGELPYVRIGKSLRFPKRQIMVWLAQRTYMPPRLAKLCALGA